MVVVSLTLDDLDLVVKALESADFYMNGTPEEEEAFYNHIYDLRLRLNALHDKWSEIKRVEDKIKWNLNLIRLGRGFKTFEDFHKSQGELLDERRDLVRGVKR